MRNMRSILGYMKHRFTRIRVTASKVIKYRKRLHIILFDRTRTIIRSPYSKIKKLLVKIGFIARFLTSKDARAIYRMFHVAQAVEKTGNWDDAIEAWRLIIDRFHEKTPIEAYIRLSHAYQKSKQFDAAMDTLHTATRQYGSSDLAGSVTQKTLVAWLRLSREKANVSIQQRMIDGAKYKKSIKKYQIDKKRRPSSAPKIAIVSAVSGGYDTFKPPVHIDGRIDYIVYSDTPVKNPGIYDVRPMPYYDADQTRTSRYVKSNISNLLPEYDYVVWVDANIIILGDIYPIIQDFIDSKKEFAAMRHPVRTSPYEEMKECLRSGKDNPDAIIEQRDYYRSKYYDTDQLIESNVLLYNLGAKNIDAFLRSWWNHIDRFSRRDQLSINYCLDKHGVDWMKFTEWPITARNHQLFALVDHGKGSKLHEQFIESLDTNIIDPTAGTPSYTTIKKRQLEQVNKHSISVVVCVHNALEDVKMCLQSVGKNRAINEDLIIVDDGSDSPTASFVKDFAKANTTWVRLIRHTKAKGYTLAATAGLKSSNADFSILLNSDTVVTKDWSNKMAATAFNSKGVGIVGPLSSAASTQSLPDHESTKDQTAINILPENVTVEDMNTYCEEWSTVLPPPRVPLVHGFCFGITREVIEAIGYFDHKNFPRGYGEENDYCFRAANAGFGLAIATQAYVYHTKSKSFVSNERRELMQAGARAFRNKHGQRRIDRAVMTMKKNPTLVRMRNKAEQLYAQQLILTTPNAVSLRSTNLKNVDDLTYQEKQQELSGFSLKLMKKHQTNRDKTRVSVVVLVYNHLEMTKRCIDSILEADTKLNIELVVVNNGSDLKTTRGLHDIAKKQTNTKVIHTLQNLNYALGNNVGFTYTTGEIVIFLNNDTYVTDGWVDSLVEPLVKNPAVHAVQPRLLYPDEKIQSIGTVFSNKSSLGYALYALKNGRDSRIVKDRYLHSVTGACLAIEAKTFSKLKGFDPCYVNGQEDTDLCLRLGVLKNESKPCYCAVSSVVYHDESKTPGRGRYVYENRHTFISRWSGKTPVDDKVIYKEDGLSVKQYVSDGITGVELYTPRF